MTTGIQEPRFRFDPPTVVSLHDAADAIALSAEAGMPLDPWQQTALEVMLGVKSDGAWAAEEFGLICARQNGKSSILEARELAGLFLFGEKRIVHSAHKADTADEAFKRMKNWIESVAWLDSEVLKILSSPGRQSIRMRNGSELSYRTRTNGGARGFSAPVIVFDEAQELTGAQYAAIVPITSSFKKRQLILTGTVLAGASVFEGLVRRGRAGVGTDLGYAEWSASEDVASDDPFGIRQANPAIGYRPGLTVDYFLNDLERFRAALEEEKYRAERLSIWPAMGGVGSVVPVVEWGRCETGWRPDAGVSGGAVGVAVSMDRSYACVGIAVEYPQGVYVEVIAQTGDVRDGSVLQGIEWVVPFVAGFVERRVPGVVVVDKAGPAFPLVNGLIGAGVPVRVSELQDWKNACAQFRDGVVERRVGHSGQVQLTESAIGVAKRPVGDAWVFDRKSVGVRVAPVESVALAAWGLMPDPKVRQPFVMDLASYL